jgi:hypothetical protein
MTADERARAIPLPLPACLCEHGDCDTHEAIAAAIREAVAEERRECVDIALSEARDDGTAFRVANRIRARETP